jgi:DNA invertase Pin-like site-specific DNA recombinase
MQRAIGYVRVSTAGQAEEGASLEAQRAKIQAWCALNDAVLDMVFEDAGLSGATMTGREGLHAALKATNRGMALVTYSISRLARSTRDMLEIAERLDAKGADLVSMTEKIDTTTAAGRMVFKMLAVLADFERDQIGERTKMALAHKKAKGEVYAATPFGFEAVEGRLVAVKQETEVVSLILHKRRSGSSLADIAEQLNASGVQGKRGGRWHPSTVRYLIQRQAA